MLFPEYQSNNVESCLVLLSICPIRFSSLPGFNWPFLPVDMGDFLEEASWKPAKTNEKMASKIVLCFPS